MKTKSKPQPLSGYRTNGPKSPEIIRLERDFEAEGRDQRARFEDGRRRALLDEDDDIIISLPDAD